MAAAAAECFLLSNGVRIPKLGIGTTFQQGGMSNPATLYAIRNCGYRLLDCAEYYGTEEQVGDVTRAVEKHVSRDKLFITSKLWPSNYGYQTAMEHFEKSRSKLGLEYLGIFFNDLYLLFCHKVFSSSFSNRKIISVRN